MAWVSHVGDCLAIWARPVCDFASIEASYVESPRGTDGSIRGCFLRSKLIGRSLLDTTATSHCFYPPVNRRTANSTCPGAPHRLAASLRSRHPHALGPHFSFYWTATPADHA